MTKNFCDKCGKEVIDDKSVRISFFGHISTKPLLSKNCYICEECYLKVDAKIRDVFDIKPTMQ